MTAPRIRHNRAVSGLTSKIGTIMLRRRGVASPEDEAPDISTAKLTVYSGGVVVLPKDALPITDILAKSRVMGCPARQTEYLHVSDLIGKCLRKIAIIETMGMPAKAQGLSLTDSLTYAQGDAIHDVMKQRVTAGGERLVWGNWQCRCEKTRTKKPCLFSEVDKTPCPSCGGMVENYVEVPMRDEELKIVGTPDLLTLIPEQSALYPTELKSISHDVWKEMSRPIPEHVIQVVFYWFLMMRLGYRITNRASIVYVTKGWLFHGNPFKEFTIDASEMVGRLDNYLEAAAAIHASRAGGNLPKRTCDNERSADAKKCEVCRTCFGGTENARPRELSIEDALGASEDPPRSAGGSTRAPTRTSRR